MSTEKPSRVQACATSCSEGCHEECAYCKSISPFAGHSNAWNVIKGQDGPAANEQFGFKIHATARAPYPLTESAFLSPYLLSLAKLASDSNYRIRWMGINLSPLSYTSVYTTFTSLVIAILSPFIGAVSDYSPSRKKFMQITGFLGVGVAYLNIILVAPGSWWLGGFLSIITVSCYELFNVFLYAYLPEITSTPRDRSKLSASAVKYSQSSQIVYLLICSAVVLWGSGKYFEVETGNFERASSVSDWSFRNFSFDESPFYTENDSLALKCREQVSFCDFTESTAKIGEGSMYFQNNYATASIFQGAKTRSWFTPTDTVMISGWVKHADGSNTFPTVTLKLWVGDNATEFPTAVGTEFKFLRFFTSIPRDVNNIYLELVVPTGHYYVDDIQVTSAPETKPPVFMFFAVLIWHFFLLMCLVHLKPRLGQPLPSDMTYWKIGFRRVYATLKIAGANFMFCRWLVGLIFSSAAGASIVTLSSLFMAEVLEMSSAYIGYVLLLSQFSVIIGALSFYHLGGRFGYLRGLCFSFLLLSLSLVGISVFLRDKSDAPAMPIFAFLIGISTGGIVALVRGNFANMIPPGQEAEYMGILSFFTTAFAWVGPLTFTIVIESTGQIRYGIWIVASYAFIAFLLHMTVNDSVYYDRNSQIRTRELTGNL